MTLFGRIGMAVRTFRPFGITNAESLMNFSQLGSLRCHCEPTDAAEHSNDRRRSCRACGNAIQETDATKLYVRLTKREIRDMTRRLRRAGIEARKVEIGTHLTDLAGLYLVSSLGELEDQTI